MALTDLAIKRALPGAKLSGERDRAVNRHVEDRVRNFLRRRHKTPGCGTRCFSGDRIFGELGVLRLQRGRGVSPT